MTKGINEMTKKEKKIKTKKPIFKKWWFWVIIIIIIIALASGGNDSNKESSVDVVTEKETEISTTETLSDYTYNDVNRQEIEDVVRNRIADEYDFAQYDSIEINDDLGTDKEGDYIVYIYLTWNSKSPDEESTQNLIGMYSKDLSATLGDNELVQEVVVEWKIPVLNIEEGTRFVAERHEGEAGMFPTDQNIWNSLPWDVK